jgi:ATP-dependent Clp protease ATP-binding subunit ClpA
MTEQALPGEHILTAYTHDLTALARQGRFAPLPGREKEVLRAFQVLARARKNNPMFIGADAQERLAVVLEVVRWVALGESPALVQLRRVVALDLELLLADITERGQVEQRLKAVCNAVCQAEEPTALFVDEFSRLVGASRGEDCFDLANILIPAFYQGHLRVIATTTLEDYRVHVERDAALQRQFQEIVVREVAE